MELKDIQRVKNKAPKRVSLSIKVSQEISDWMAKNKVSPTRLFLKAIEPLMNKPKKS